LTTFNNFALVGKCREHEDYIDIMLRNFIDANPHFTGMGLSFVSCAKANIFIVALGNQVTPISILLHDGLFCIGKSPLDRFIGH
jgi:hypothetical protein